jgi:uncharacterized membrane protein
LTNTLNPVARWVAPTTWALSFVGLGLSIYLTIAHYAGSSILACSSSGVVNCGAVITSSSAYVFHIPVAVLGLVAFTGLLAINSPWAWRSPWRWLHQLRFYGVAASMVFVLWLIYCEIVVLNHICEYCTFVHIVTLALLIILTRVTPRQLGWGE